jgi:protein-L-isoaspartate(D-aspartate) O-methyltransferase
MQRIGESRLLTLCLWVIRMFIPVGDRLGDQYIWVIDKKEDGSVVKERTMGVRYVPLTDAPKE